MAKDKLVNKIEEVGKKNKVPRAESMIQMQVAWLIHSLINIIIENKKQAFNKL